MHDDAFHDSYMDDEPLDDEPFDQAPILDALLPLMADGRTHTFDLLLDGLVAHLPDDPDEAEYRLDSVLEQGERFLTLDDERWIDLHAILEGRCFTHELTGVEAAIGVVPLQPDIDLALLSFDSAIPFADGTTGSVLFAEDLDGVDERLAQALHGGGLAGPKGWLGDAAEGTVVGLWFGAAALSCRPTQADSSLTAAAAEALSGVFAVLVGDDQDAVELIELVLSWLLAQPDALRVPHEPLTVLLAAAGLEGRGDYIGRAGSDWMTPHERRRITERALDERLYGFDDCCHDALALVTRVFAGVTRDVNPRDTARALSHGQVSEAFMTRLVGLAGRDLDEIAKRVVGFADELVAASRGPEAAGPLYVQSVGFDILGEVVEAEDAARAALRADPDHRAATETMAGYLDERGEAARALEHLSRAGVRSDDPQAERLADIVAHGGPKVGRNEPCPCGSGRKFKACCIDRPDIPPELRFRWLYEKALAFVMHPARRGAPIHLASHAIDLDDSDEPPTVRAVNDRRFAELSLFDEGLLERFLDEREPLLPDGEVEIAEAWLDRRLGLYEAVEARPDEGLLLRDTRSGETWWALERSASHDIEVGELIVTRLLPFGDDLRLGGPVMRVPLRLRESVVDLTGHAGTDACDWAEWIGYSEAPPRLQNREGDALALCTARYRVPDGVAARAALAGVLTHDANDDHYVQFIDIDGDQLVRGWIKVEGDEVLIDANSVERRDRLGELVQDTINGAVFVEESERPADDLVRAAREGGRMPQPQPVSAEAAEALAGYLADYARKWVDLEIPALGGMTPRQAVNDPTRREDLLTLIRDFERDEGERSDGSGGMPTSIVRQELGLS